jgi:eukaryotic-like serine/threonine-protein kinase
MAEPEFGAHARPARPMPPRVGRYDILLPIASGGMATVYLARSRGARGFERQVALKLTHAHLLEDNEFASLALDEAKLASRIRHRNVVTIVDVGDDPLGLFLVMEYIEGDTLAGLLRRAATTKVPMPARIGARILLDTLAGLHAAHELRDDGGSPLGVVHRDVSPQNVLVGLDGVAQLSDFGIAKAANRTGHTATGVVKGKVSYMAPEQAKGLPIDRRADVWSAGVVAWELLAQRKLYPSGDGVATLLKVVHDVPPLLRTVRPEIVPEVEAVVAEALSPDVEKRTPSAAAFARQLSNAFGLMGRMAEPEEVAAYVEDVAGPKLAARRAQVKNALRLRADMDALANESMASAATPSSGPPQNLERLFSTAQDTAPSAAPSLIGAEPVPAEPRADDTVAEAGLAVAAPPVGELNPIGEAHTALTDTTSTADHSPAWAPRKGIRIAVLGVVAASATAFALLYASHSPPPRTGEMASVATTTRFPTESAPVASDVVSPPSPAVSPALDSTPEPVHIHANAAISQLQLDNRVVRLAEPLQEVLLARWGAELTNPVKVSATSADGRRFTGLLRPEATSLNVEFPPVRSSSPASSRSHPALQGLAPNPYGR